MSCVVQCPANLANAGFCTAGLHFNFHYLLILFDVVVLAFRYSVCLHFFLEAVVSAVSALLSF